MEYEKATRQAGGQVLRAGDPGEVTAEQRLAKQLFWRVPPEGLTLGKGSWSEEGPRGWPRCGRLRTSVQAFHPAPVPLSHILTATSSGGPDAAAAGIFPNTSVLCLKLAG